jgi:acyl-CoA hydrolase/GNAT superfamily N-acetyltransferase
MAERDWQGRWPKKVCTPEAAVKRIARGRRILIGSGAAEPTRLVDALVTHGDHLADNEIVHLLTLGPAPYVKPGLEHRFRHSAFFIGANVREAVQEGRADFIPVFLSEIPSLITSRRVRIDVVLIQVSPPDRHGYASLGVSVDIVRAAVDSADLVLAEVNPRMPRTLGDSFVHVDRIDCLIPVDAPLLTLEPEPLDDVCRAIGRHVASLVPDGATLQTGIGRIPHAVAAELKQRRDLGIHTEMLSDSVLELVEAGAISGRKKTLLPGKIVTSFVMGSQRLYDWVDDNPAVEMKPSDFTNDPFTVARNDTMIAINSALGVDLTGQVASDTLLGRFFSGIGGQVDFVRGAARSRGGKSVIALPSTAKDGAVSRILPAHEQGAGVVTSRGDVRYIVTEYGIADLWGKNIRERAMSLIAIAHPDFRGELLARAKQRRYVFADQIVPRASHPWAEEQSFEVASGRRLLVRPVRVTDEEAVQDLLYRLSDESTYLRFMQFKRSHPHEEMLELVDFDYEQNMALVVVDPESPAQDIIAIARYDVDPATGLADIAFVVRDDWQRMGIGTMLMRRMTEIARARGLSGFSADVLAINKLMLGVFQQSGLEVRSELWDGVYAVRMYFPEHAPRLSQPGTM